MNGDLMTILVTGAAGMIGSQVVNGLRAAGFKVIGVDRISGKGIVTVNLADKEKLRVISEEADRIIHLAALAHTEGVQDLSWEKYKTVNVDYAKNVFEIAGERPVLFISTIDVYGFYDGKEVLSEDSPIKPVSRYGKSKAIAEEECMKLHHYTIFRFCPVYSDDIKRDIQKRYYLKYPTIAYQVGKGTNYEILNIKRAVAAIVGWCTEEVHNDIRIIKDPLPMWTPDYIRAEKEEGRASIVLHFPQWTVICGYKVLKWFFGESEKTYLLNKAVHPLRTKSSSGDKTNV